MSMSDESSPELIRSTPIGKRGPNSDITAQLFRHFGDFEREMRDKSESTRDPYGTPTAGQLSGGEEKSESASDLDLIELDVSEYASIDADQRSAVSAFISFKDVFADTRQSVSDVSDEVMADEGELEASGEQRCLISLSDDKRSLTPVTINEAIGEEVVAESEPQSEEIILIIIDDNMENNGICLAESNPFQSTGEEWIASNEKRGEQEMNGESVANLIELNSVCNVSSDGIEKCVGLSFDGVDYKCITPLNERLNKSISVSVPLEDKSILTETVETANVSVATDAVVVSNAMTSPIAARLCEQNTSAHNLFDEQFVAKAEVQDMRQKYEKLVNEERDNYTRELAKYNEKIGDYESELFLVREEYFSESERLQDTIRKLNDKIEELSGKREEDSKLIESIENEYQRVLNENVELRKELEEWREKRVDRESKDTSVTGLVVYDSKQTSFNVSTDEKCVGSSFVAVSDECVATDEPLAVETLNKSTNVSLICEDKCSSTETVSTVNVSMVTDMVAVNDAMTSPLVVRKCDQNTSPHNPFDEQFVAKRKMNETRDEYEKQLKEKDAAIERYRELLEKREAELKSIRDSEARNESLKSADEEEKKKKKRVSALREKPNNQNKVNLDKSVSIKVEKLSSSVAKRLDISKNQSLEKSDLSLNQSENKSERIALKKNKKENKKREMIEVENEEPKIALGSKRAKTVMEKPVKSTKSPLTLVNTRITRSRAKRAVI